MSIRTIELPFKTKKSTLATGSQTKNTLCFLAGKRAYLSELHQDLTRPDDFLSFEKDVKYFLHKKPKIIAYDLHPEYQSSKYALSLDPRAYTLEPIQHHHAHIVSCMIENELSNQKVIGIAFDGTGLGADGTLWGGEFLVCNYKDFKRVAYLKEIPLFGGERAILEPWRLLVAWTNQSKDQKKLRIFRKMSLANFNSPLSSSMGRLFDAAASLILGKDRANYEAELAIELERLAGSYASSIKGYNFKIIKNKDSYIIDPTPIFKGIAKDLQEKLAKEKIAYRFHLTVAEIIEKTCQLMRKRSKINKVVLSGGVFQNKILLNLSLESLKKNGFKVFFHKNLSCNDSGISLGQAVIASYRS